LQTVEVTTGKPRTPTPRWLWVAWLLLSGLAWGGIATIVFLVRSSEWTYVPFTEENFWILRLRFEIMPVVGTTALVAPLAGLIALLLRRWRRAALAVVGVVATLQFAYVGFEKYLQTVDLPGPSLPDGFEGWPALERRTGVGGDG
jgi:hypothetical protein